MSCSASLVDYIKYIIDNEGNYFFRFKNVNGFGLGYKYINGIRTNQLALQVFVEKKLTKNCLNYNDIIPVYYKGIPIDVIEVGVISACDSSMSTTKTLLADKIRPMIQGYSIGPNNISLGGTSGCVVENVNEEDRKLYVLSNNHVIANNNALEIGHEIVSPSYLDDTQHAADNIVAKLSKYEPIIFSQPPIIIANQVDCAIAEITDLNLVSSYIYWINKVKGIKTAELGLKVQKSGRTTGYTTGTITSLNVTISVQYGDKTAYFKNQIATTKMSNEGDSGSLVLDMNKNAVGLLFSNTDDISYLNPIDSVLSTLNIKFL